ncbi:MAG TPA: Fe-Mn family superoxide dismutase [Pseudonocardia sp.]
MCHSGHREPDHARTKRRTRHYEFTAPATTIQGSGWAILARDPPGERLHVVQLYDQQANVPIGLVPVVMLDMWEHAFYLQYKNVKPDYVKAWWNAVNRADAQSRFDAAR